MLFHVMANYPYRNWARGVERAWKSEAEDALAYADSVTNLKEGIDLADAKDVYLKTAKTVDSLRAFLGQWLEDAQINKGLWVRVDPKIPRERTKTYDVARFIDYIDKADSEIADIRNYAAHIYDAVNPNSGWRYEESTKDPAHFAFYIRGIGHRLAEAVRKASTLVTKATKYLSDIRVTIDSYVPEEIDVQGMKVVFQDSKPREKAGPAGTPEGRHKRHPYTRTKVVEAVHEAKSLLDRRGLGFLWYGNLMVMPQEHPMADMSQYSGLKSTDTHAAAHYVIGADMLRLFFVSSNASDMAKFVAHELGHRMWYKFLTETDRAEFASLFGDVPAVSEYGSSNAEEDFAEVFAHYVDGRDLTRDQLERFKKFVDKHKKRTASKALEGEYPHKEWAQHLYQGWEHQLQAASEAIHEAMEDPKAKPYAVARKEVAGLKRYIDLWKRDAITNRGFQHMDSPGLDSGMKRDAVPFYKLDKAIAQLNEFLIQQGNVDQHLNLADFFVQDAVKAFSRIEYQFYDEEVPEQVDVNGVSVVFEDWKPNQRQGVIREVEKAYALLRNKGLGFLWYGPILVGTPRHFGVKHTVSAWYMPHYDRFGVTSFRGDMARNLAHEFGHRLWFKYFTETDRAEFASQFGDVPAVSAYGATDAEEDFAEVFADYIDGQDLTRDQLERFRKFVSKHQRRAANRTAKPISTIDKHRVQELAKSIAEVVLRAAVGSSPLDYRVLVRGAPFEIQGVSGPVELVVRVQTIPTTANDYVVNGGYGKTKAGQPAVLVNLNGSIPASALAFAAKPEYGILQKDLYVLLMHEFNHAADWHGETPKRPTTEHVPNMHEIDMVAYANDPSEVRAHTQEIIADIETHKADWYPKMHKHFGSYESLRLLLKNVDAWQRVEAYLTDANKIKIMKDVWYHIQGSKTAATFMYKGTETQPTGSGMEKTTTTNASILTVDDLVSIMTPMKTKNTTKTRTATINKRAAAAVAGTLEVSAMSDFEARMRAKLGL